MQKNESEPKSFCKGMGSGREETFFKKFFPSRKTFKLLHVGSGDFLESVDHSLSVFFCIDRVSEEADGTVSQPVCHFAVELGVIDVA